MWKRGKGMGRQRKNADKARRTKLLRLGSNDLAGGRLGTIKLVGGGSRRLGDV